MCINDRVAERAPCTHGRRRHHRYRSETRILTPEGSQLSFPPCPIDRASRENDATNCGGTCWDPSEVGKCSCIVTRGVAALNPWLKAGNSTGSNASSVLNWWVFSNRAARYRWEDFCHSCPKRNCFPAFRPFIPLRVGADFTIGQVPDLVTLELLREKQRVSHSVGVCRIYETEVKASIRHESGSCQRQPPPGCPGPTRRALAMRVRGTGIVKEPSIGVATLYAVIIHIFGFMSRHSGTIIFPLRRDAADRQSQRVADATFPARAASLKP